MAMKTVLRQEPDFSKRVGEISGEMLSLCYQCGTCTASCPMGVPVRRLIRSSQLGLKDFTLANSDLWNCATCKLCETACPRGVQITDILHALRVIGYEEKKSPKKLDEPLWGVYEDANPWGGKKSERAKWAENLGIKDAEKSKVKYLLYVGCAASFDPRLQKITRSLAKVLGEAGVDFGILGEKENCCGDVIYHIGEEGFLEELVQNNLKEFEKTGAEAVISISPHCFNMFKSVYPKYGKMIPAYHYTELLSEFMEKDLLPMVSSDSKLNITYHDPCYLGRYHGIYEGPRKILESLPGASITEMADNKSNSLCCGGGGGQMWMESIGERPSHQRVLQAVDSGASILATSCPYCVQNFEDAAKTKGVQNLQVMDLAEIVARSIKVKG
jgi:Fe-S oxidoreductase